MGFVPVTEAFDRVHLALPDYVPLDQIGIDLHRIDQIANLGGFASGVTIGSYSDPEIPSICCDDDDAHPVVWTPGQGDLTEISYDDSHPRWSGVHGHPPLDIRISMSELARRVSPDGSEVSDPAIWSQHIEGVIDVAMRDATWDHLVRRPQWGELLLTSIPGTIGGQFLSVPGTAWNFAWNNVTRLIIGTIIHGQKPTEVCWSLTPGVHPDRALLVSGVTRATRVIRKIDPQAADA